MSRFDFVSYDQETAAMSEAFKLHCEILENKVNELGPGHYQMLALTRLEEFFMYVGKALRKNRPAADSGNL